MVKEEKVMEKLKQVMDPETELSIVDMGFIYDVEINGEEVNIEMTLTSPGCPLHSRFKDKVKDEISQLDGVESVEVKVVFDPPWSPEKMSDKAKEKLGME